MKRVFLSILGFIIVLHIIGPFQEMSYQLRVGGRLHVIYNERESVNIQDLLDTVQKELEIDTENIKVKRLRDYVFEVDIKNLEKDFTSQYHKIIEDHYQGELEVIHESYIEKIEMSLANIFRFSWITILYVLGYILLFSPFIIIMKNAKKSSN